MPPFAAAEEEAKKAATNRQWVLAAQGYAAIPSVKLPTGKSSSNIGASHSASPCAPNGGMTNAGQNDAQTMSTNIASNERNHVPTTGQTSLPTSGSAGNTRPGYAPYGDPQSSSDSSEDDFWDPDRRGSQQPPPDRGTPSSNRGANPPGGGGGGGGGGGRYNSDEVT